MLLLPPRSTLFPYTTLFRSQIVFARQLGAPDLNLQPFAHGRRQVCPFLAPRKHAPHPRGEIGGERKLAAIIGRNFRFAACRARSEEHTSELQSRPHLVCRLL